MPAPSRSEQRQSKNTAGSMCPSTATRGSDCDMVYGWVQKASAYLGWWRKVQSVELTLAKARVYNETGEFDISRLICAEEKFLTHIRERVAQLSTALCAEDKWDKSYGKLGDEMMRKIAMKISPHVKSRTGKGDMLWNVSACAPWFSSKEPKCASRQERANSSDIMTLKSLMTLCEKLEVMVWSSRGECPGWKSNLLEDMKDVAWLILKGELDTAGLTDSMLRDVDNHDETDDELESKQPGLDTTGRLTETARKRKLAAKFTEVRRKLQVATGDRNQTDETSSVLSDAAMKTLFAGKDIKTEQLASQRRMNLQLRDARRDNNDNSATARRESFSRLDRDEDNNNDDDEGYAS